MSRSDRRMVVWVGIFVAGILWGARSAQAEEATPAAPAFDREFSARATELEAPVGPAGKVVLRFAPPVAAPIDAAPSGQPLGLSRSALIRPCDSPGSGCRNPQPVTPQVSVPPVVPGTRPPRSTPEP
jgi:hypothetical protein